MIDSDGGARPDARQRRRAAPHAPSASVQYYSPVEYVIYEGDFSLTMFFIAEGILEVSGCFRLVDRR